MLTAEDIKARARRQPFVPFQIVTSAGDRYAVLHPDLVWVGRRFVHVGIATEDNPGIFDKESCVSFLHIAALDDLAMTPPPPTSNGQKQ